jgi:crotonobetainyl-CoA:carnitine CoA-transferase CaiB-like acyl-CoA transferase
VLANPIKLDGERLPSQRAPSLGEHTRDVLRELGYEDEAIDALRASGAA